MGRVDRKREQLLKEQELLNEETARKAEEEARIKAEKEAKEKEIQEQYDARLQAAAEEGGVKGFFKKIGISISRFGHRIKYWFTNLKLWKRILIIVLAVLLIAAAVVGAWAYSFMHKAVDIMNDGTGNVGAELTDDEDYDLSIVDVDGYVNILLLGVDSRNMDNIKGTRSDMIMIASINTETYDVTLTSVYRDTYLKLGDTSTYDKITHACVYGGPEMTIKSLNQAMDLNIQNYAIVNFKVVADIVDAVGGIEVDVQEKEIYQLNKYTKATARNIGETDYNLVTSPGVQTLQGVQAVSYGRIRKGVGDDFKRTERMRIVVSKVFEKAKKMSFSDLKKIVNLIVPQVKTNLQMEDILALGIRLPKYSISSGAGWPYHCSTGNLNKVSYVFPANLAQNTLELHQTIFGQEDYTPSSTVYSISSTIASRIAAARSSREIENEETVDSEVDTNLADNNGSADSDKKTDKKDQKKEDTGKTDPAPSDNDPGKTDPNPSDSDSGKTDPTPSDNDPGSSDSGKTDPAPVVDPTPVDPTPVDPTPVDPTPVDPTPVDPTPTPDTGGDTGGGSSQGTEDGGSGAG